MRKLIIALSVAASLAVAPAAHAADDAYLRVDGITGDATVQNTPGFIPVGTFSWGAENVTSIGSATGGAASGKVKFDQLTIEKAVDATSPALFQRMATGTVLKGVELVVRKPSTAKEGVIYLRYHFQTAFVSSTETKGGSGADGTRETVTFSFGVASQEFRGQGPTGAALAPVFSGWNTMRNLSLTAYPAFGTAAP